MPLDWNDANVRRRVHEAAVDAINATMSAAILHAKSNHGAGTSATPWWLTGASAQRFQSRTGELERSVRVVREASAGERGTFGQWGSIGLAYARRIELGFQGKDSLGRVVDSPPYPYLGPAADAEYPKVADRMRVAFERSEP